MVDNGEDGVASAVPWELRDQVHGYDLERVGVRWDRYLIWRDAALVGAYLRLLADGTSRHVFCDPLVHRRPPVVELGGPECLVTSWVSGCYLVVGFAHE